MDIVARIQQLMTIKGIHNPNQLAKLSGIPQTTLSSIFNHKFTPSVATLELLCNFFGITMVQFFSDPEVDASYPLTERQKELINRWNCLTEEQQNALLQLMDTMK